jgi:DNA primase
MARFTRDSVDRVKEAADIVEIVSAYTDLRQRGKDYWGNCPFHEERTPSFKVNPQDKLYYCFGCEASGDLFRFVEEKEGRDFPEAVEVLAERYGVELERESEDPRAEESRRRRARLWELLERTAKFYESYLWRGTKRECQKAREYLASRGLREQVLRDFGVGLAPSAWDSVFVKAQREKFTVQELLAAGLAQKGRSGGHYDRFRSRITFPIRDQRGRVLGFGGRALSPDSKPKYLNSPEGELYRKSSTLYGIDRARGPIAKARRAIVVEGYTDVLALHQAGVEEAVAIMGTAITPEQLSMLAGLTEAVVLALDADRAGADAMIRAQRVAGGRGLELRVAAMPEGEDPADMLQDGSIERFDQLVDGSIDLPSFHVRAALDRGDLSTPSARERVLDEVAKWLASMAKPSSTMSKTFVIGRDELIREVSERLDTDPSLVSERVRLAPTGNASARAEFKVENGAARAQPVAKSLTPRETRERALFAMCIADPKVGRRLIDELREEHLSRSGAPALRWLKEHLDEPLAGLPRDDAALSSLITELVMRAESEPASEGAMQLNFDLLEQQRLEDGISAAQKAGDYEASTRLASERAQLTERIAHAGLVS